MACLQSERGAPHRSGEEEESETFFVAAGGGPEDEIIRLCGLQYDD